MYFSIGDSRVVEQTHKFIRSFLDTQTPNGMSARASRFLRAITSPVLGERTAGSCIERVALDADDLATPETKASGWWHI
jgi:hypothetical protein